MLAFSSAGSSNTLQTPLGIPANAFSNLSALFRLFSTLSLTPCTRRMKMALTFAGCVLYL